MKKRIAFVLVVEAGDLEVKSSLLVHSIRKFSGLFSDAPIWAIKPRLGKSISSSTIATFNKLNVNFLDANLNQKWSHYGVANKIYAAAFAESILINHTDALVLLDSDTLFLQPPTELFLENNEVIAVRPVDTKNVGLGWHDDINSYWNTFFKYYQVDVSSIWPVRTTSQQEKIKAYFNSGLVSVNPKIGIFQLWKDSFESLANLQYIKEIDHQSKEFFHLDQVSLASLLLGKFSQSQIKLLNHKYNFPLHLYCQNQLPVELKPKNIEDLAVVHYHHLFYKSAWFNYISSNKETRKWLSSFLPLVNHRSRWSIIPGIYPIRKLIENSKY